MTVEQFNPQTPKKSSNSAESQTTTLDIPSKMIEEQANNLQKLNTTKAAKIGFVSLGCQKTLLIANEFLLNFVQKVMT